MSPANCTAGTAQHSTPTAGSITPCTRATTPAQEKFADSAKIAIANVLIDFLLILVSCDLFIDKEYMSWCTSGAC